MKWETLEEEPCSLARTVAVIGDRWSLLILRECFLRKRRFEAFQASLGITRHLLAERLKKLVRFGVLRRIPYQESPKRYEYILTQKGLDLYPIIMSIVHWGNIHMVDARGRPMLHEHKACGKLFDPVMICSECGEPLTAKAVHVHPGPGARQASPACEGGRRQEGESGSWLAMSSLAPLFAGRGEKRRLCSTTPTPHPELRWPSPRSCRSSAAAATGSRPCCWSGWC
jgi:DNA-binding HxlR family transcriptional regulator